jgi:hypothetical protein
MCMTCHKLFKRVIGKNQKLDVFVWGMRALVIILNLMPLYLMNYVSQEIPHSIYQSILNKPLNIRNLMNG